MVDSRHKHCESTGCNVVGPSFGTVKGKGRYCITHKEPGMTNVMAKQCEHEDCETQPAYDVKGGKGRFCGKHKSGEMINVRISRCSYDGCNTIPSFGNKKGEALFCIKHKTSEMTNVKAVLCEFAGCPAQRNYGIPGHRVSRCFQHREVGMIRRSNAKCKDCKEPALWGIHHVPRHCDVHKTSDDENLVERPCVSCSLPYILDNDDKCENCNPAAFATARLAKQNALMDSLDARGLAVDSTDKMVEGGACGKERPDRIYDFSDKFVVLECDEHQHRERACDCEQTRMVNIGQSFGGIPVYFIRWNPDDYSPESSRKKPEDIAKRYKLVGDLLEDIREGKHALPVALVAALYLYYDGWSSLAEEEWHILTPRANILTHA